jgi:hypothetical protein
MSGSSILNNIKLLKSKSSGFIFIPFKNALQPIIALFLISFLVYFNTLNHEVAFDDESVIHKNEFVIKGVKGIKDILFHDSYYSYYKQLGMDNTLPGGRYRPLSQITFAIEQEFIGTLPDGIVNETSWDLNNNGIPEQYEDTNNDGLFTDYDFWVRGSGFRHFINVLFYAILIIVIYIVFSKYLFKDSKDMVFFCCILFALHPLHTEVVANIKSRDEIMSLLFIFLTLFYVFRFTENQTKNNLIYISVSMFLALMSKEYALLLFVFIPVLFYVLKNNLIQLRNIQLWMIITMVVISSIIMIKFFNTGVLIAIPLFFLFIGYNLTKKSSDLIVKIMYALGIALIAYFSFRFSATTHQVYNSEMFKNDIMGNPYLFATVEQEWASKIVVWLRYLKLFFMPNPLISDYSFKSLPYSDFSDFRFWITIVLFCAIIGLTFYGVLKRKKWSLGLIIFLLFFLPICNLFIDIGATMGERLLFHSSLGLCLLISMLLIYFLKKTKNKNIVFLILFLVAVQSLTYAVLTIKRNPDWKNNNTLFTHDVEYVPENINVLLGAGSSYYDLGSLPKNKDKKNVYLTKSIELYNKGIKIYPKHFPFYLNKSISFFYLDNLDSALACTDVVIKLSPNLPNVYRVRNKISMRYMLMGIDKFENGDKKNALAFFMKSLVADKQNDKAWCNLAKALHKIGATEKAISCYQSALKINPKNKIAIDGLNKIEKLQQNNEPQSN